MESIPAQAPRGDRRKSRFWRRFLIAWFVILLLPIGLNLGRLWRTLQPTPTDLYVRDVRAALSELAVAQGQFVAVLRQAQDNPAITDSGMWRWSGQQALAARHHAAWRLKNLADDPPAGCCTELAAAVDGLAYWVDAISSEYDPAFNSIGAFDLEAFSKGANDEYHSTLAMQTVNNALAKVE